MSHNLKKTDIVRLKATLETLPAPLKFLKPAILHLAKQDQEMLGTGTVDDSKIAFALESASNTYTDATIAQELQQWIDTVSDNQNVWAGPLWFIQAYLSHYDKQTWVSTKKLPPLPIAAGLEKVTLDIPLGMKVKLLVRGIELRRRGISIFIIERVDDSFDEMFSVAAEPPPVSIPLESPFQPGPTKKIATGHFIGFRNSVSEKKTGTLIICRYLIKLPIANVQVEIFATGKNGIDVDLHEQMIATIRPK